MRGSWLLYAVRILLAFDKFKGSLTAKAASEAVVRGLRRGGVTGEIEICPIADGGEGFTDAVITALGGEWLNAPVHDAQGRKIIARYGLIHREGSTDAVMEMSAASGLALVSDQPLNPHCASTYGTGEMMRHAQQQGVRRIIIGIGGSATNDGGIGMAAALGFRFIDASGNEVSDLPSEWERVIRIERPPTWNSEIIVASDVTNPLLGEQGATRIYGPQKGVTDIAFFEARLQSLADMVQRDLACDHRDIPGAGAAGGLGFGLMSFCGAQLCSGFNLVANITSLRERIAQADLVITGEGRLDAQSLNGKGPVGVAGMARAAGKPVVGIGGLVESRDELMKIFDAIWQAKPEDMPVAEAVTRAAELLEDCVVHHAHFIRAKL
ncbi:MAG: glycerate kinase [Verrucomicrobia bacterium]|nr:glycerate kinase [Verrucomicrobiota bacterium]